MNILPDFGLTLIRKKTSIMVDKLMENEIFPHKTNTENRENKSSFKWSLGLNGLHWKKNEWRWKTKAKKIGMRIKQAFRIRIRATHKLKLCWSGQNAINDTHDGPWNPNSNLIYIWKYVAITKWITTTTFPSILNCSANSNCVVQLQHSYHNECCTNGNFGWNQQ